MMKVPASFKSDVRSAYKGDLELDDLIKRNEEFLRGLARFSLRWKSAWYVSDEDDMYQEACYWLIRAMWDWDKTKGVTLERYVVYNIGVRLGTQIEFERAKKRHPRGVKIDIWDTRGKDVGHTWEETIPSHDDIETVVAIRRALDEADKHLTKIAKELLHALIKNDGHFKGAIRELLSVPSVRQKYGPDEEHLKYVLRRQVMPEIFHFLSPVHIIPESRAV
jgi:hypothetical protein